MSMELDKQLIRANNGASSEENLMKKFAVAALAITITLVGILLTSASTSAQAGTCNKWTTGYVAGTLAVTDEGVWRTDYACLKGKGIVVVKNNGEKISKTTYLEKGWQVELTNFVYFDTKYVIKVSRLKDGLMMYKMIFVPKAEYYE